MMTLRAPGRSDARRSFSVVSVVSVVQYPFRVLGGLRLGFQLFCGLLRGKAKVM